MPPRYLERLERQSQAYKEVFNQRCAFDYPPSPSSKPSRTSLDTQRTNSTTQTHQTPSLRDCDSAISTTSLTLSTKSLTPSTKSFTKKLPSIEKPALPPNALVLVTAANGWQGSHVVDQLLSQGYRVRGAVRDVDKAIWTNDLFLEKYGQYRYSTVTVPDMLAPGAYDTAVRGCSGVVHCASVTTLSPDPTKVIISSIAGAINALEAAAKEPHVLRFVYTSCTCAAANSGSGARGDITSGSWNMSSFLTAWQNPPYDEDRIWAVYASSKLQTEQAMWRWMSDNRPQFTMNAVLPATLWGRILNPQDHTYPPSVQMLRHIWDGNTAAAAWVPPQYFVDVQDSALLHVAALIISEIQNERIFAATTPYNINSILGLMKMLFPNRSFGGEIEDHGVDMTFFREAGRAEEMLKRMGKLDGFTDMETSLLRNVESWHRVERDGSLEDCLSDDVMDC